MSKPGRNEPCHCGSGKKYKKCCIEKDTAAITTTRQEEYKEEWEPEDEELYFDQEDENYFTLKGETDEVEEDDFKVGGAEDTEEEEIEEIEDIETEQKSIKDKEYPVISEADKKLVDEWWDKLDYKKEPEEIKKHLEKFMEAHPKLVENLGLEHEVLFELGSKFNKKGIPGEYIEFLLFVRKNVPEVYSRSAGYYDADIIAWLIAENRQSEIESYLEYFKKYPEDFIEQFFEVVDLLKATNNEEPLITLAKATYKKVTTSQEIINGNSIIQPLVSQIMSKFLLPGSTDNDIHEFVNALSNEITPVDFDKSEEQMNKWKRIFNDILRPFECWSDENPNKKSQMEERYIAMSYNFRRFLHEKTGISWMSAWYYSEKISDYLLEYLNMSKGKIKQQFNFSKENIDKIVGKLSKRFIFLDCTTALSLLEAIYHFATYLEECGNFKEQDKLTIHQECFDLYKQLIQNFKKQYIEANCFKSFPLFAGFSS